MEEASSITKAIENAWNRAGQPQEFSIKILEHPQTSFFGLKTAKSAKIALFFNEIALKIKEQTAQKPVRPAPAARPGPTLRPTEQTERSHPRKFGQRSPDQRTPDERQQQRTDVRKPQHSRPERNPENKPIVPRPESQRAPVERPSFDRSQDKQPRSYTENRESWTPEMVDFAQEWIKETLVLMGKSDVSVNTDVSQNYLKISLSKVILDDARQEETQLKSWGSLAMEAVREKVQKPLRNLRIILESKR